MVTVSETTNSADDRFLEDFFTLALPADAFDHAAHVRLAWLLLAREPQADALARFRTGLKAFAAHHGVPGKYHETVTRFALALVAQRRRRGSAAESWPAFVAGNPDLFDDFRGLLARHYSPARLGSEAARDRFLPPDRPR